MLPNASVELYELCSACQRVLPTLQEDIDDVLGVSKLSRRGTKFNLIHKLCRSKIGPLSRFIFDNVDHKPIEHHKTGLDSFQAFLDGCHMCTLLWKSHCTGNPEKVLERIGDDTDPFLFRLHVEHDLKLKVSAKLALRSQIEGSDWDDAQKFRSRCQKKSHRCSKRGSRTQFPPPLTGPYN